METAIYTQIIKINQKVDEQCADRLTRILSNAISLDQDKELLISWLKKINDKLE